MEWITDWLVAHVSGWTAYGAVFLILLACGLGLPIPEDITLFAAGVLAYNSLVDVYGMILVSLIGVMVGDSFTFLLGYHYGSKLVKKWPFSSFITESRLILLQGKLHEQGSKVIFAARFMPGMRAAIFFSAGTLKLPFRVFFFYDGSAALISVPAIIYATYYFGEHLAYVLSVIRKVEYGIVGIIVFFILVAIYKVKFKKS